MKYFRNFVYIFLSTIKRFFKLNIICCYLVLLKLCLFDLKTFALKMLMQNIQFCNYFVWVFNQFYTSMICVTVFNLALAQKLSYAHHRFM